MLRKIIFVTGNKMKVTHANEILNEFGFEAVGKKMDIIEPREEDPGKVVVEKAIQAFEILKKPLIVEDAGIFIRALGGFPKTYIHFIQDTIGVKNIVNMMEGVSDRHAEFRQSLAYISTGMGKPRVFSYVDGDFSVADKVWESKYDSGEFDKILIPPGESRPLCMFPTDWRARRDAEKNKDTIHYKQLALWLKSR